MGAARRKRRSAATVLMRADSRRHRVAIVLSSLCARVARAPGRTLGGASLSGGGLLLCTRNDVEDSGAVADAAEGGGARPALLRRRSNRAISEGSPEGGARFMLIGRGDRVWM